jgi:hypothetical protein
MILDGATAEANKDRFIRRVIESEIVFYLTSEEGVANSISNEDERQTVLMFWSEIAYAKRVQNNGFEDYNISEITLFDFLYRWLPGMSGDNVLVGVNWNQDLVGRETDPYDLRTQLEAKMGKDMLAEYEEHYNELSEGE